MKQLKIFMFILLAITIFSCYSAVTDCPVCDDNDDGIDNNDDDIIEQQGDIIWELAGGLSYSNFEVVNIITENNGNIWAHIYNLNNYQNELYLSTNNGDTWFKKSNTPFMVGLRAANPINGYLFAGDYNGLYRSIDNGENWEHLIDNMDIFDILITPSGEIYMGCRKQFEGESFLWYSNDNGSTWIENKGLPHFAMLAFGVDGTLYAGNGTGIYHSTDGGVTWLPSANYNNEWFYSLTICDDGSIFGTIANVGIVKSTDKGVNWTKLNTGSLVLDGHIIYNNVTKDIFVSTLSNSLQIYRSDNLGKDWKLENMGLPTIPYDFGDLTVNPKTGQMFIGTNRGVYRTKNYPK